MVRVDEVYPFGIIIGCLWGRFFQTPNIILWRVPGVWVLSLLWYFNCWNFLRKTPNHRYPFGYQIIFISRNVILLAALIWTLYCFILGRGVFLSVCIFVVNWRCRLPYTLNTAGTFHIFHWWYITDIYFCQYNNYNPIKFIWWFKYWFSNRSDLVIKFQYVSVAWVGKKCTSLLQIFYPVR